MRGRAGLLRIGLSAWLALGVVSQAAAHAVLQQSSPATGASVPAGPLALDLKYNSRIDQARSRISLTGPGNATQVLKIDPTQTAQDHLSANTQVAPGDYVLHWQVLSIDGHVTRGDVKFTVTGK